MDLKLYFTGNAYDTPENTRRFLMDRLFAGSRWFFIFCYIGEVFRTRPLALKKVYDRAIWADSSHRIFTLIEGCGGRFHLRGLDHLRCCTGPVVFISNHMSTLETFVLPCIIAPLMEVTFVVKESLVQHFLFGPIMRSRAPIVVKRINPREDFQVVMQRGKELLSKGTSVIIFPQSTRTAVFNPGEFNSLGVKLAKAAGVKVVPVAVKTDFWENGKYLKDIGPLNREKPIHIIFGTPMNITGSGKEEHRQIVEFIVNNLEQWGAEIRQQDEDEDTTQS
jgi:1-acyl-sn-glycerol-3-phosphate acyltransferase